uniref:Uncharacterized protein MANES_13G068200 n=1 Tax=Rhizophora mucronata TaxID=61149 RepID=A0A2P2K8U7_RHIMU
MKNWPLSEIARKKQRGKEEIGPFNEDYGVL